MRYLFKAISTNTKDLRTGLVVIIEDAQYIFNVPDGFQRVAHIKKLSFHKTNNVFVSSLMPDHFAGVPGFYLSAREGCGPDKSYNITLLGPIGMRQKLLHSFSFLGGMRHLRAIEMSEEEALLDQQKFGMRSHLIKSLPNFLDNPHNEEEQKMTSVLKERLEKEEYW